MGLLYDNGKIVIRPARYGNGVFAIDDIAKEEVVFEIEKRFIDHPTRLSIQVGSKRHQECSNEESFKNMVNHSCSPNGWMDMERFLYKPLRDIKKGEQLSFNYLTTEYDMANPFVCGCGENNCYGFIRGYKHLTPLQQHELFPMLSQYLRSIHSPIEVYMHDVLPMDNVGMRQFQRLKARG